MSADSKQREQLPLEKLSYNEKTREILMYSDDRLREKKLHWNNHDGSDLRSCVSYCIKENFKSPLAHLTSRENIKKRDLLLKALAAIDPTDKNNFNKIYSILQNPYYHPIKVGKSVSDYENALVIVDTLLGRNYSSEKSQYRQAYFGKARIPSPDISQSTTIPSSQTASESEQKSFGSIIFSSDKSFEYSTDTFVSSSPSNISEKKLSSSSLPDHLTPKELDRLKLIRRANKGDPNALLMEGYHYEAGIGVKKDMSQAEDLYRRAAVSPFCPLARENFKDFSDARIPGSFTSINSAKKLSKDMLHAKNLYRQAAQSARQNLKDSRDSRAPTSSRSLNSPERLSFARNMYNQAMDAYNKSLQRESTSNSNYKGKIGKRHEYSLSSPKEESELKRFGEKLAASENANEKLGNDFRNAQMAKQEAYFKATLQKAKKTKGADDLVDLGECYERGLGVAMDHKAAARLYKRAAKQEKNARAFMRLGHCYETGLGVEKNIDRAISLYELAAKQNYPSADSYLKSIKQSQSSASTTSVVPGVSFYQSASTMSERDESSRTLTKELPTASTPSLG